MWTTELITILVHQLLFQGVFVAKNLTLQRRLGRSIRGSNPEARRAISMYAASIVTAIALAAYFPAFDSIQLLPHSVARIVAWVLLILTLGGSLSALIGL